VSIALTVIVVLTSKIAMTEQPHETGSSDLRASAEQRPVGPIECIPTRRNSRLSRDGGDRKRAMAIGMGTWGACVWCC
jgi:hypothetical protein